MHGGTTAVAVKRAFARDERNKLLREATTAKVKKLHYETICMSTNIYYGSAATAVDVASSQVKPKTRGAATKQREI